MCIMEVRPGQASSTIVQAMAHNTSTIERDLDMLVKLLKARHEDELLAMVLRAQDHLKAAYGDFLEVFGEEVDKEVNHSHNGQTHSHSNGDTTHAHVLDEIGQERQIGHHRATLIEQAHHDATLARRYETR